MARLGDICRFQSGGTPSKGEPSYFGGDIPWITTVALNRSVIGEESAVDWITEKAIRESAAKIVPANSIMVGTRVGVGKVAINSTPMSTSQDIISLLDIDESKWSKAFVCKFILAKGTYLNSQARGATIKGIKIETLADLQLPDVSLEEQCKIAHTIDRVSELIALRKEQLAALDQLVKSRFIELFGDQETNPFGWTQCTIGECCTLKSGTSLSAEVENEGGPIPYVKVGDMNYPGNERYITTSSRYVSEATAGKGIFEVGSILFPKRGGAIGTNKKRMTKLPICADLNVMGVSSNSQLLPEYLLAYFDMIDLGALSDGSSVPQINNKNIAPLVICVPPMELQKQFAAFVEETDKSKLASQRSLDELETLKKALMQKYFG